MIANQGHVLTDDIVVDYKNRDRDDCLHFLTHLDPTCKDLSLFISPTAKRIYTSVFNAWFLKMNFDVGHIDVQGFKPNKSYKITFKGNKYIYSFIDSKFTTGSVVLLLHGAFGTYIYTGNFCYYPSFWQSPVILPVIEAKALTRLYLDNTYYEQPSNFLGFHDIATKVAELIKSQPLKNFYIYADKVTMDPLLAEIASKLEEKVYVCQSTMEIMKMLGHEAYFTRHSNESRIFVDKAFIKKRGFGLENIAVYINRYSESCKSFQNIEKRGNVYNFYFYCHSNHKEICELLRILKPESMTFLFSEIDKSKLSYDFKFKYDLPKTVLFKDISTNSFIKVEDETNMLIKNIPRQLMNQCIVKDNTGCVSKDLNNERSEFSQYQDSLTLSTNSEVKNLIPSTSENNEVSNLSKGYICPLRIRKVPEINNTGLSNVLNCTPEDSVNKIPSNSTCNKELSYKNSNELNNSIINPSNFNIQSHSSLKNVYNLNSQTNNSGEFIKLANCDSTEDVSISNKINILPSFVVKKKPGMPLMFNSRLVKEKGLNENNSKFLHISDIGASCDIKKNTVILNRKIVNVKKPLVITVPSNDIQKNKLNDAVENGKHIVTKKTVTILKPKTADSNSNVRRPNALLQPPSNVLNLTKLFQGWMDKNISIPNNPQTSENSVDDGNSIPEKSISVEPQSGNLDRIQLEAPGNNAIEDNRNSDSLKDSIDPQITCDINQSDKTHVELQQAGNQIQNSDISSITSLNTSVTSDEISNQSPHKSTVDPRLELLHENISKNNKNEFGEKNCQTATKNTLNKTSKRHLSDDENRQLKKKLRTDNIRESEVQVSDQQKKIFPLKNCKVLLKQRSYETYYFYSSKNNCYLPKFYGFKKYEVRPRSTVISLRNLQKLLEN